MYPEVLFRILFYALYLGKSTRKLQQDYVHLMVFGRRYSISLLFYQYFHGVTALPNLFEI